MWHWMYWPKCSSTLLMSILGLNCNYKSFFFFFCNKTIFNWFSYCSLFWKFRKRFELSQLGRLKSLQYVWRVNHSLVSTVWRAAEHLSLTFEVTRASQLFETQNCPQLTQPCRFWATVWYGSSWGSSLTHTLSADRSHKMFSNISWFTHAFYFYLIFVLR